MKNKLRHMLKSKNIKLTLSKNVRDYLDVVASIAIQLNSYNLTAEELSIINKFLLDKPEYYTSNKALVKYYKRCLCL